MNCRRVMWLAAALVVAGTPVARAQIGYSVSDAKNAFYSIDLKTGKATELAVLSDLPADAELEGLAFDGTRVLGVSEPELPPGDLGELWNLSSAPPAKLVGISARIGTESGADFDPTSGKLYNVTSDESAAGAKTYLYSIDVATGAASQIGGAINPYLDGLAIDASGKGYASDFRLSDSLYSLDLATGAPTLVGAFGVGDTALDSGLAFGPDGTLWALSEDGSIYTVDKSTGAATFQAFVVDGSGARLAGDFEGLAVVPEPSSLLLGGLGLAALLLVRFARRRVGRGQ